MNQLRLLQHSFIEPTMKSTFGKEIYTIKVQGVFRVLTALGVLLALSLAPVQASTGGKIAGVVTDANTGDALPNANIIVVDSAMGTTADEKGRFFILNVPTGTYTLRATYIGYAPIQIQDLIVSTGPLSTLIHSIYSRSS